MKIIETDTCVTVSFQSLRKATTLSAFAARNTTEQYFTFGNKKVLKKLITVTLAKSKLFYDCFFFFLSDGFYLGKERPVCKIDTIGQSTCYSGPALWQWEWLLIRMFTKDNASKNALNPLMRADQYH